MRDPGGWFHHCSVAARKGATWGLHRRGQFRAGNVEAIHAQVAQPQATDLIGHRPWVLVRSTSTSSAASAGLS